MNTYTEWIERIKKIISLTEGQVCLSFYDLDKKDGFSIDGDKKVLSASMIKLLIMAELMLQVSKNKFILSDKISIKNTIRTGGDGILKELDDEHDFTLKELMTLMIIVSDNRATNILIDFLGINNINLLAKNLALRETSLGRKMMDGITREQGNDNYTCTNDISTLFQLIYEEKLINKEASQLMLDILLKQQQGERLQRYLPANIKIAHKCGDLDNLENDGGIIWLSNKTYILVVLTSGMSNLKGKQTIGKISKFIHDELEEKA